MPVLYANNAASRLAASITNVATSFSVTAGHGAKFPAISGGDYFYATLMDTAGNLEVVKVTARATDTFTVARAQEGTTARAYAVNDIVELRITKAMLDDFKTDTRAGNAATATSLQTARTIGGVSFNGTANINLPGVNAAGNQSTTGNAATATALQTARTIGGVSFNGTANINLPGVNAAGNQNTTGSAATLTTARSINGTSFNGSANITTANWGTARDINGTSINGSANYAIGRIYDTNYRRVTNPGGAESVNNAATTTGAIAVTLPVGVTNTMVRMTIKIYEYTTNEAFEVHVGGYNYTGGTWANSPFAYIIGNPGVDRRFNVRLGYNTTTAKFIVYIGELASTWSYPQVYVTEVLCGHGGQQVAWTTGWSVGFEATAFQSVTATISNAQVGYAVSTNTANSAVLRDGSGNFSAGTITAALTGNASTATTLQTARTINGTSFNGSANITVPVNTSQKSDSVAYQIPFVSSVTAGNQSLYTDSAANITYNPSTNTLTTTTFAGALSGNASTATALQTARTINGVSFNGTANITIPTSDSTKLPLAGGALTGTLSTTAGVNLTRDSASADPYAPLSVTRGTASNFAYASFTRVGQVAWQMGINTSNSLIIGSGTSGIDGTITSVRLTLDTASNLTAAGNITANSDERLKKDWAALPVDFVERLAGVKHGTYTRIDSGERQIGVSAQALQPVAPEGVMGGEYLSVAYGNVALVSAIELAKRLIVAEKEIAVLKELTRGQG